jgi:hypothetical protein
MNNYEFYDVALSNINLFFIFIFSSILLHYFIFRNQIKSILDPYMLAAISSVFCLAVIFLLYFSNYISFYLFLSYILTQVAFFLGLYTFRVRKKINVTKKIVPNNNKYSNIVAFYFFSVIYIICQVVIFEIKGIPLFMESRLETFANGGGTGILGRISDVSSIFSLYTFFLVIKIDKFRFSEIPKYIMILLIFITLFLSGSKSSFLIVFSVFWCYINFTQIKGGDYLSYFKLIKENIMPILIFSLIIVLIIIKVQTSNLNNISENALNPFLLLSLRLVHSGDVYWYAYPSNIYLSINGDRWFSALFTDTLGLLRIYDWDKLPEAIGITLKNIHHPSDILQGPNARHNVFGLVYFGFYWSIFFSYSLGIVLSFIRNKLPYIVNADIFGGGVFTYLMCRGASIDSDPMLAVTYLNNLLFIFPILFIIYLFLKEFFCIQKLYEK